MEKVKILTGQLPSFGFLLSHDFPLIRFSKLYLNTIYLGLVCKLIRILKRIRILWEGYIVKNRTVIYQIVLNLQWLDLNLNFIMVQKQ